MYLWCFRLKKEKTTGMSDRALVASFGSGADASRPALFLFMVDVYQSVYVLDWCPCHCSVLVIMLVIWFLRVVETLRLQMCSSNYDDHLLAFIVTLISLPSANLPLVCHTLFCLSPVRWKRLIPGRWHLFPHTFSVYRHPSIYCCFARIE